MADEIKKQEENKHLTNLVAKIKADFNERVESEENSSNVLLKGHLLIENILEECLAVFDQINIKNRHQGFYVKTKILSEITSKDEEIENARRTIVPMLFSLNEIRNNLAHDLNFNISEADINKIGVNLGSEYIIRKYDLGHKKVRENLLFLLNNMVHKLGFIIFAKMEEIKKNKGKN